MTKHPCPSQMEPCTDNICDTCGLCNACCDPTVDEFIQRKRFTYEQGKLDGAVAERKRIVELLQNILDPFEDLPVVLRALEVKQDEPATDL